jgi:hypothetical protein
MPHEFVRRTVRHRNAEPLAGYSLDLIINAGADGKYVLKDLNSPERGLRVDSLADLLGALVPAVVRSHDEHFAAAPVPAAADA